ncbi:DMT family transporter [Lysinibacillus sp. NPDC056959]|uniref:DMT family transporter n=1 Tax=Lysinibacillus sp. NPDC056959 TaxID=3345981 RepID=UPI0036351437
MVYTLLLFLAILLEIAGVAFLNLSEGFTVLIPTILAILFYNSSITVYILITKNREVGIVGALFAGLGTALVIVVGILFFNESVTLFKFVGIALIIFGAVLVNLKPKRLKLEENQI